MDLLAREMNESPIEAARQLFRSSRPADGVGVDGLSFVHRKDAAQLWCDAFSSSAT